MEIVIERATELYIAREQANIGRIFYQGTMYSRAAAQINILTRICFTLNIHLSQTLYDKENSLYHWYRNLSDIGCIKEKVRDITQNTKRKDDRSVVAICAKHKPH